MTPGLRRIIAFGALSAVASCRRPSPAEESYVRTVEQWRSGRLERLTKPDGWLSLAGLFWLKPGGNSVGSERGSDVALPASAPARAGTISLEDGKARWDPASGSSGGAGTSVPLVSDAESNPTIVRFGSVSFLIHQVGERSAVRVRDSESLTRKNFKGLKHFPVSSEWRLEGRFIPYSPPRHVPVPTVLGSPEDYLAPGEIEFVHRGKTYRLMSVLEPGADQLFIIFGDRTNGKSTYGGGRFVYAPMPKDGRTVLDLNRAYNPPCVFTPYATCPLPPPLNHLSMEVTAGEKTYAESWELKPHR